MRAIQLITLTVALLMFPMLASAQNFLGDFTLAHFDGKVQLQWAIRQGNTCDGVRVYRSADSISFTEIGRIEGVCGSPYSTVTYNFTDTLPIVNTRSFYRLELGNLGFSAVLSILVNDFSRQRFRIEPHPVVDVGRIYFDNPSQTWHSLQVFDIAGQLLLTQSTRISPFVVPAQNMKAGPKFFLIADEKGRIVASSVLLTQ